MNWVLAGVIFYVLLQLAIGLYVSRRTKTETDYLLAGRRLGYFMATMSIFATWFGAETCIGSSAAVYEDGLAGSRSDPFGYTICLLFMGLVFAVPLYRRRLTTLGDLFRQRYGGGVEKIAALVIVPSSVIWAGAQIHAFGQVISAISNIRPEITILCAAIVVVLYTGSGGLLADAVTDAVQGVVLILGLFFILFAVVGELGGAYEAITKIDPEKLNLLGEEASVLERIEAWAIPIFGSVLAQELISRTLASRSEHVAKRSALAGAGVYFIVGAIPVIIALIGGSLVADLEEPDQFLPTVADKLLHPALYVVFAGALISAILSTVDSALLAAAALMSHNVILPLLPNATEELKVRLARICVVAFGAMAYLFAIREGTIHDKVEEASAFGSAGILIVGVFALFSGFGGKWAAGAALVMGSAAWLVSSFAFALSYPYLIALFSSLVVYVVIASLEPRASQKSA
ncbi:MAG: sodium:solute symporter family protein [Candidatus Hydrogenedentes bacterium]|nr:sodium:solute symporter family protein [Candidatus Hydrogenedentota bacterium]